MATVCLLCKTYMVYVAPLSFSECEMDLRSTESNGYWDIIKYEVNTP